MSDTEREQERLRWADRIDLEVLAIRSQPDQYPERRIMASVLDEWANRLRFNEPDGNNVPRGMGGDHE
jgi:hypothetical protein